jgi:uncharacterized protein YbcC (UPF0753/DUF2309 family)
MTSSGTNSSVAISSNSTEDPHITHLREAVHHAAHLLPTQGPIQVFIHHNTLHAFESRPFHDAVRMGQRYFRGEPYPAEEELREARAAGRITEQDVDAILAQEAGSLAPDGNVTPGPAHEAGDDLVEGLLSRTAVRRLMLEHVIEDSQGAELDWHLTERGAGREFRRDTPAAAQDRILTETLAWLRDLIARGNLDEACRWLAGDGTAPRLLEPSRDERTLRHELESAPEGHALAALWHASCSLVEAVPLPAPTGPEAGLMRTHRDAVLELTGFDIRDYVNPLLARWVAAYLDQGLAYWPMPDRQRGLLPAVRALYSKPNWLPPRWLQPLGSVFHRQEEEHADGARVVLDHLAMLGVNEASWDSYMESAVRGLPGWAGMVHMLEVDPTLAPHGCPPIQLMDFLALQLTLERLALEEISQTHAPELRPFDRLLERGPERTDSTAPRDARAYRLFQVLQLAGVSAPVVLALDRAPRECLVRQVDQLDSMEVRRLLLLAYERHYRQRVLTAIHQKQSRFPELGAMAHPRLQFAFCIDEREESIRRHIEELAPQCVTLAIAGFFGIAVAYQGLDDRRPAAHCPVGVDPRHVVREVPLAHDRELYERRRSWMRRLAQVARTVFVGSRSFVRGWITTLFLGLLAMFPLTLRVFLPGWVARLRHRASLWLLAPPRTDLTHERSAQEEIEDGRFVGFSKSEMLDGVERVLRTAGLTTNFAQLVVILGHGSTSLNNPHESAHDCGACGGRRGAPNARLFARFANHPDVRSGLAQRGIEIPATTWFVGGCHDTCNDGVDLFDLDHVPQICAGVLAEARAVLDEARARNAHERCRRFLSIPLDLEPGDALSCLEARSEDLSEPRPEYGHATNACAFIGRRELTRGLFLDRRAFLVSYDPTQDRTGEILERLLTALVPVAAGISLEYYFSRVDNERYGCGSKLPHNVSALLGVVNGHSGDLLTGLPWQMVEVHEPMRLLAVVESEPELLGKVVERIPHVAQSVSNEWIQVACVHPSTRRITVLERGRWVPLEPERMPLPVVASSRDWYSGRRGFVWPAIIHPEFARGAR